MAASRGFKPFVKSVLATATAALVLAAPPPVQADDGSRGGAIPRFVVDPYWPKPLPDRWVTGAVGGLCIDKQDHVFGINRLDLTALGWC